MSLHNEQMVHGVLVHVKNKGVLLTGKSGIGKSELALSLISMGHALIADDIVLCQKTNDQRLEGRCPEMLQDFLEVRGLGILPMRLMFGDKAIHGSSPLDLIVHLVSHSEEPASDRTKGLHETVTLFGVDLPKVTISIAPGRHLAVLVESAVMLQSLADTGYHANTDFIQRQQAALQLTREPYDR